MKSLLVISALLLGMAAQATPSVGDDSVFDLNWTANGSTVVGTLELSLTSYDQASDSFVEHVVITDAAGTSQASDQTVARANLLADAVLQNLPAVCPQNNGTLVDVTVSAGTFQTCSLAVNNSNETGNVWIGNVPFGVVQQDVTENGQRVQLALRAFTAAKK